MNLYVANLSYRLSNDDLRKAFEQYGEVSSAKVIMDRDTGRSRGFGFVEMPNSEEGEQAIAGLNGVDIEGKEIAVSEARPRTDSRPPRGNNGGGYGERRFNSRY
jgi:RNA recognition motif-containing protein